MTTKHNRGALSTVLVAVLVLFLGAGAGCSKKNETAAPKAAAEQEGDGHDHKEGKEGEDNKEASHAEESVVKLDAERAKGIKTAKVEKRPLAETLRVPAEIHFNERNRATVGARVSGRVERVVMFANQAVAKDELLAEVYSPEFLSAQQEYQLILSRAARGTADAAALAKDARHRLEILGLTPEEIDTLAKSGNPYPLQHVHSPMAGVVIEHKVASGDAVQPGQTLFVVADLSSVWAEVSLTEPQLGQVRMGQAVTVSVKSYPERRFKGELVSIAASLDEATRTAKARALIQNTGRLLRPGMFAEAEVVLGRGEAVIAVPEAAVLRNAEGKWVAYVEDEPGEFKAVEVNVVRRVEGRVVVEGLTPGAKVVTEGGFFIQSELAKGSFETHNH